MRVVYFGTYSKKLIPALRIGYIVCPRPLRAAICQMKQAMESAALSGDEQINQQIFGVFGEIGNVHDGLLFEGEFLN